MFDDYSPVTLPAIRVGETDGRFIDCALDLGAAGDTIPSTASASITITRQDGNAITASDLALASGIPATLDSTGLIYTVWFTAPAGAAGVPYVITLTANTTQGRTFKRDCFMTVLALMG